MTMEDLFNRVEMTASRYEQACQREEALYDMIRDAENNINRYGSQASLSEDTYEQKAALERMKAAALSLQEHNNQLQQVQSEKAHALRELEATRAGVTDAINSLEEKIPRIEQSISSFEQMASLPFGGAVAMEKLSQQRARRAEYQQNLNHLYTLADRIDSVLNGGGSSPQLVLRRR